MSAIKADPVVTEIIRGGVIAATEEMKSNLMRTAYNMIIYEALDFTVGLYGPDGETLSIGLGLPSFIRGMSETVKAKIAKFGKPGMQPGDIYITDDSTLTGSHLNHITLTVPIFNDGELIGFACCMAHWLEVGGALGGMTTDIFVEGLQLPILILERDGVVNQDLIDIIRMNLRLPDRAMGDLRAQVTAVKSGAMRFSQLAERYGNERLMASLSAIADQLERSARERTLSIPDGVYTGESHMDDDGVDIGKPVSLKVRVEVSGDEMTINFSEVSPQVKGFFNSGITTAYGCAQMAYKFLTSPTDYPINEGSFRSLHVVVPPGTVVSAGRTAPMRWWMSYPMTLVDTIIRAVADAIPGRVAAGHHADLLTAGFHGISPATGEFFIGNFGPLGGGWGAKSTEDGVGATVCSNDGDTHNSPNEQMEAKFPVFVECYGLRTDSGGAGQHRGGLGIERVVRARANLVLNTQIDRVKYPPWGLAGGDGGSGNEVSVTHDGEWREDLPNGKLFNTAVPAGTKFRLRSGGGGGYGDPLERPVGDVAEDVRQGYVSLEAARRSYGVVLDPASLAPDAEATARLRKDMSGARAISGR